MLIKITVTNRGDEDATLHVLPTLWFRNTWTWSPGTPKPVLRHMTASKGHQIVAATHAELGERWLCVEGGVPLLFTENETNNQRIHGTANATPYVKDGINDYVIHSQQASVNPACTGTKAAAQHTLQLKANETIVVRLRLMEATSQASLQPFADFDAIFDQRLEEADEFYRAITLAKSTADEALVMRQALAGMIWSKQYFLYEVDQWIQDPGGDPFSNAEGPTRNREWGHMVNADIISMPDKWEYPW